jgi:stress-induced morphogen
MLKYEEGRMSYVEFDYEKESKRVKDALREEFPHDTIATSPGYKGRVHVKIVSERFNGISEREKQQIIWDALHDKLGEDQQPVSLALAYGTDEL